MKTECAPGAARSPRRGLERHVQNDLRVRWKKRTTCRMSWQLADRYTCKTAYDLARLRIVTSEVGGTSHAGGSRDPPRTRVCAHRRRANGSSSKRSARLPTMRATARCRWLTVPRSRAAMKQWRTRPGVASRAPMRTPRRLASSNSDSGDRRRPDRRPSEAVAKAANQRLTARVRSGARIRVRGITPPGRRNAVSRDRPRIARAVRYRTRRLARARACDADRDSDARASSIAASGGAEAPARRKSPPPGANAIATRDDDARDD